MSTDGKIKTYKNPDRNKAAAYKPYVPQYQIHGTEPREYQSAVVPDNTKVVGPSALPSDNPRAKRPTMRQPYATAAVSPVGRGRGPVPNVGNNMEHTWSSVDGQIVDDLSDQNIEANHTMIDNNDYVTSQTMGYQSGITADDINPQEHKTFLIEDESQNVRSEHQDLLSIAGELEEESYLLIVAGVTICSGPMEEIQDQATALVFGDHEMCDGNPTPIDDIIILKRVKVKVGLFLE